MSTTSLQALKDFQEQGVVKLFDVIDPQKIAALRRCFWQAVQHKFAIALDDSSSWFTNASNPVGGSRAKRLNGMGSVMRELKASGKFDDLERTMTTVIDHVYGAGVWRPLDNWYSLLSFPGSETVWDVPHESWHNDEPIVVGDSNPWSLFVFVFLDDVSVDMGATTVVSGSHRRAEQLADKIGTSNNEDLVNAFDAVNSGLIKDPKSVRLLPTDHIVESLTKEDAWLQELVTKGTPEQRISTFLQAGSTYNGIEQKVVPLTGAAGDIVILNPRCLHTFSANISALPRQVIRLDFRRNC